jgi:hypothetical protein
MHNIYGKQAKGSRAKLSGTGCGDQRETAAAEYGICPYDQHHHPDTETTTGEELARDNLGDLQAGQSSCMYLRMSKRGGTPRESFSILMACETLLDRVYFS